MIIMGLNGWTERGHDAGASLIIDGNLVFAIEEEKIIRKRYAYDCKPINSIRACLEYSHINLDDIDYFVIGWEYEKLYSMINLPFISKEEMSLELFGSTKYANKILYVDHHLAHAYSSFYPSEYDRAIVAVLDGQGEYMGTSIYLADKRSNIMTLLYETPISLGYFYTGITKQIGFHGGEEGKTMGLSAYGTPVFYENIKKHLSYQNGELKCSFHIEKKGKDEEDESVAEWQKIFSSFIPPRKDKIICIDDEALNYANLANSGQAILEEIAVELILYYAKRYAISHVTLSGGVCLNCPMVTRLERAIGIESVFVQPAANDGGISVGAAIYGSVLFGDRPNIKMIPYLGTSYSNDVIFSSIKDSGLHYKEYDDITSIIPKLILDGKIIALFNGRLEFGPRALGNRSLICRPDSKEMFIRMNTLKGRELWRPLDPAILYDCQDEFFDSSVFSPHMTKNMRVLSTRQNDLQTITHVDGTARVQSVTKEYNENFYRMIDAFYRSSGIPVVVNTSFNVKGEPIVCTPDDAIDAFKRINVDYLCLGNYLIKQ